MAIQLALVGSAPASATPPPLALNTSATAAATQIWDTCTTAAPMDPPTGSVSLPPSVMTPTAPGYESDISSSTADQERAGFGWALTRQLFAVIISSQIFDLGYLWMLRDDKNRTWHNKIAGSAVTKV